MVTISVKSSEIFTLSWELATIKMSKLNAMIISKFLVKIRKQLKSRVEKGTLQHDIIEILNAAGITKIPSELQYGKK